MSGPETAEQLLQILCVEEMLLHILYTKFLFSEASRPTLRLLPLIRLDNVQRDKCTFTVISNRDIHKQICNVTALQLHVRDAEFNPMGL